jgi:methylthioribulose-1-phosphate dehydratase
MAELVKDALAAVGRRLYARGWVMGTSGNFSVVSGRDPLRLIISSSGVPKGELTAESFVEIDDAARPVGQTALRPSAEALLHVVIANARGAGAVLHTHSIWATVTSRRHCDDGGRAIEGLEMLKGLDGVTTHEHREWIPILPNSQDISQLAADLGHVLASHPDAHAVLLAGHGMYTWGKTLADAERHVEILEFLLETSGRLESGHGYRSHS